MTEAHADLADPPPLPAGGLRVVPLGGLGAIGRNMTVFEYDGKLLIVDCGVLFPDVEQPGVDLILPDFAAILDRLADVQAIVLTHGHEDHIGAVPYLLAHKPEIPLVGSQFTLALVEAKLAERRIEPYSLTVHAGQVETLGPFRCEFFAVNHSIPDALAVAITTPAGLVLHTGDFKMDQLPLDGRLTDLAGFARLGRAGVDLLLSDSTNAEVPGFVAPEREIGPVLTSIFAKATGRIIVASFASHVHRVQQVLDAAHAHQRKVTFIGRSMQYMRRLIDDAIVMRREIDHGLPREAIFDLVGMMPVAVLRVNPVVLLLSGHHVVAADLAFARTPDDGAVFDVLAHGVGQAEAGDEDLAGLARVAHGFGSAGEGHGGDRPTQEEFL